MSKRKLLPQLIGLVFTIWLLAGCGSTPTEPTTMPTPVPPPATATMTVSAESGFITGRVHLQAPPTPPMVVYAVDNTTGAWSFTKTQQTDGEASFTLEVPPGSYQVFAFSDIGPFAGYSEDGWVLATVTVAAGQTVSDIIVRPPGQSECGAMFGLPASPDGRFAAIDGPSEECRATAIATIPADRGDAVVGMPNPASAFCEEQGGQVDIRSENGGEVGYCVFPDGSECEEWDFFRGECVPVSAAVCHDLADDMEQMLGVGVTITAQAPFEDYITGQTGTGCQVTATGTGLDFENVGVVVDTLRGMFQARGWQEDISYDGGGPTGMLGGYRQDNMLCLWLAGWEPSEDANCPSDQPISACELSPDQKLYTITLNCAQDTTATATSHPERIQFAPDAISSQVQGSLAAGGLAQYVLTAMAGQEMTVRLETAGDPAEVSAILVIWGKDGTVLISDHAGATTWTDELPSTQDYYIDVRSVVQVPINYTMEVIIPPATNVSELLVSCSTPVAEPDYWPAEGWRTATPEEQGMSSAQLATIFDYIAEEEIEIHSILIVRNGYLVLEAYGHGYDAARQHILYSVTKSVTSALIGIAVEEGHIESVEQPILEFFPDRMFENTDDAKRAITIEDVLTMRAGIDWRLMLRYQMFTEPDWTQFVLDRPMAAEPGTEFLYNDGTAFVLSVILQNAVGVTTIDFADQHLFQPLGITDFTWETSTQGFANTAWGLHLTPRDMAKFGHLYLHDGEWDGQQIVPGEWVKASTQPHVDLRAASDPVLEPDDEAYGYMWWIYPGDGYYAAQGLEGQQIWVVADHNLVIVFTARIHGPTTPVLKPILDDHIIPAIVSDTPLDPDPDAFAELEARARSLGQ